MSTMEDRVKNLESSFQNQMNDVKDQMQQMTQGDMGLGKIRQEIESLKGMSGLQNIKDQIGALQGEKGSLS